MTIYLDVTSADPGDKGRALAGIIGSVATTTTESELRGVYQSDPLALSAIPGTPFAYWIHESVRRIFRHEAAFDPATGTAVAGVATGDDTRFLRCWWEAEEAGSQHGRWRVFAKGGPHSPYYSDLPLVIDWLRDGMPIELAFVGARVRKPDFFRSGLTWPIKNRSSFKPWPLPSGCVFAHVGPAAFVDRDVPARLLALQGLMSSAAFTGLLRLAAGWNFEAGIVQRTPVPALSQADVDSLAMLARAAWSLGRNLDAKNEVSHAFVAPPLGAPPPLKERGELATIQRAIDRYALNLYSLDDAAAASLTRAVLAEAEAEADDPDDEAEEVQAPSEATSLCWLVGVAFGRFDHRLATGERTPPPEPEPFDPLPTRSPGMWPENEPRAVEPPAILVDDPHHKLDLVAHVTAVAHTVGITPPENLRAWLAKDFFPLHIKMYSKSRRKAPIYWQLATPSASYSVWLYIHAFTKDTFFHVEGLVADKVLLEEGKTERLRNEAGDAPSAAIRKALAAQETFLEELRGMVDEVRRVKPLWKPDLDDGVVINFAPLWRLVPHHKAWQKELRTTWDSLVAGEYDWAHLAMHLWPERVVPKCATDRSLAIAHGLEDVFWVEDANGKWKPRATPTRPVADLVAERTSAAVIAARDSLLKAPSPGGGGGGGKKKRAAPKLRRPR